jgi:hypothetical protein
MFLRSALLLVALFVSATAVRAAAPGKPVEFGAKIIKSNSSGGQVKLMWMANREGGVATSFDVYMAKGETEDMSAFDKIGTVNVANADEKTFYYLVSNLEPGTYTFYVIAVNADGSSQRSIIKVVTIAKKEEPKPGVVIKSERSSGGKAGVEWAFQVKAEGIGGVTITGYAVEHAPDGLSIDKTTGKMTWTNPTAGRHVFVVIVTGVNANGETVTAKQEFVLEIGDGENHNACAAVFGTVKDENGESVKEGVVVAWMMKAGSNGKDRLTPVSKASIRDGVYVMELPAGTYKFRVEGHGFYAEWYENVGEPVDAKSIEVACNTRTEVNFVVALIPEPTFYMAYGMVIDAETGKGLENALVTFTARKGDGVRGEYKTAVAETDADGNYEVKVCGYVYIATAIARPANNEKNLYMQEWWEETHDVTTATPIEITGDVNNINFTMDLRENYDNGFHGQMVDNETGNGVPGKVVAYLLSNDKEPNKSHVETVATDNEGNYEFTNLVPGVYLVYGIPGERPWVPGWYVDGEHAAESWKHATKIEVGETMVDGDHDIRLVQAKKEIGRGRVSGWCYDKRGGIIVKDGGSVQGSIPVVGAIVIAKDAQGNIVDFAMADAEGKYSLEQMGLGTFSVMADRIFFESANSSVVIDDQNLDVLTSFGMHAVVSSVEVPTNLVGTSLNLYPNPARSSATLTMPTTAGAVSVRIVDMMGTVISTNNLMATEGTSSFVIETASLPMGMVMVHVTNGGSTFALPLQIVR